MYSFLRSLTLKRGLTVEAPVFLTAFLIAEFFYKFRSFTLECLAFLATWYLLSAIVTWGRGEAGRGCVGPARAGVTGATEEGLNKRS